MSTKMSIKKLFSSNKLVLLAVFCLSIGTCLLVASLVYRLLSGFNGARKIASESLLHRRGRIAAVEPNQIGYPELVKKVREFSSEDGAFAKTLLLCKGQQRDKLEKLMCPMLNEMKEDFELLDQSIKVNGTGMKKKFILKKNSQSDIFDRKTNQPLHRDRLETKLRQRMKQIATDVNKSIAELRQQQIEGLKKTHVSVDEWAELYQLKSYLMVELNNVKKVVKLITRDFTAPVHPSVLANVHSCLITLDKMDTFLAAHPGFDPGEMLLWTLAEFGVSLWAMAALKVHPDIGQIAQEADKSIVFQVPTLDN